MAQHPRRRLLELVLWTLVAVNTAASCWLVVAVRLPQAPAVEAARDVRLLAAVAVADAGPGELAQLYGLFSGLADYLAVGHPGCDTTPQLLEVWARALVISGWKREAFPKLTDLVEAELKSRGFSDPQPLGPRAPELVDLFRCLAGGVKDAGT